VPVLGGPVYGLILRYQPDNLGGQLGESLDTALRREVKEETGLDVTTINSYLGSAMGIPDRLGGQG